MAHGPELTVVIFLCVALALGVVTRIGGRSLKLPYTVIVLLFGCLIGFVLGHTDIAAGNALIGRLDAGTSISADVIIFVFLPALIFESAFAFDVHAFRKDLAAVTILAGPALLASTAAVGVFMAALAGWAWGWSLLACLVFGALISATDPVAVVAILRDTPSPKRLGVLIEGESLLNDGTAIVLFWALLAMLASPGSDLALGARAARFVWVVGGGVGVGLALGIIASTIIGRVFNDALVEITLTIVTAYAAMIIAEAALHVSGVMAIVTAGLWLAGPGRTRISPEVEHFLHQFWGMVSYLANTLIFFIVGLVIATHWQDAELSDVLLILAAYVGVMAVRFVVTFAFRPVVGLVGDPLSARETVLLSWGGLRGAVSLALALIINQQSTLPPVLRHQILLVTTGVVLLTILINGSSVAWLLGRLGLTTVPIGKRIAGLTAESALLTEVGHRLEVSTDIHELRLVAWDEVIGDVHRRLDAVNAELARVREALAAEPHDAAGHWHQALEVERRVYWHLHGRGLLDGRGVQRLDHAVALQLDDVEHDDLSPPAGRLPRTPAWRQRLTSRFSLMARIEYGRLAHTYELARAQSIAAEAVLVNLERLGEDELLGPVRATYQRWQRLGKQRVEELRSALPEVVSGIETRLASRIRLNMERAKYEELLEHGAIDPGLASDALADIQRQMKCLQATPMRIPIPETATIVARTPLFSGLSADALAELAAITAELVFESGSMIIGEDDVGDSMYVIARGAVEVCRERDGEQEILGVLGGGEIVGEMSLITNQCRIATVRAATTVTAGRISREDFERVMERQPGLRDIIWTRFAAHQFDNLARGDRRFSSLKRAARDAWYATGGPIVVLEAGTDIELAGDVLYLVAGVLEVDGVSRPAPMLLVDPPTESLKTIEPSRLIRLAPPPDSGRSMLRSQS